MYIWNSTVYIKNTVLVTIFSKISPVLYIDRVEDTAYSLYDLYGHALAKRTPAPGVIKFIVFGRPCMDRILVLGRGQRSHIVKMHYFSENLLLYSWTWFKQTKFKVMMTKVGSTIIVNLMNPVAGVLV